MYKDEGIRADPKHFEYLAKTQFDYVKADKRLGEYLPGEVIPYNTAKKLLSDSHELVKPRDSVGMVLKEPILHHMPGTKITRSMLPDLSSAGKPKIKASNEDIKFSPARTTQELIKKYFTFYNRS